MWFKGRGNRLTASNFGSVIGVNPHNSAKKALQSMLWPTPFSCAATEWGQKYEDTAADLFSHVMKQKDPDFVKLSFPGLVVPLEKPWLGASPDAVVHFRNGKKKGLEIKCPFKKELYPYIPSYYYAQVMGTCGLLGLPSYYFEVWTPEKTRIEEYAFHKEYFWEILLPKMEEFYFLEFLPRAILREKGVLKPGQLLPTDEVAGADGEREVSRPLPPPDEAVDFIL